MVGMGIVSLDIPTIETPARKCLHVLPLLEDTSKKGFDGEDLASAKIKTS